jgi:hypothetical protein
MLGSPWVAACTTGGISKGAELYGIYLDKWKVK